MVIGEWGWEKMSAHMDKMRAYVDNVKCITLLMNVAWHSQAEVFLKVKWNGIELASSSRKHKMSSSMLTSRVWFKCLMAIQVMSHSPIVSYKVNSKHVADKA